MSNFTLGMIKPDAIERGVEYDILKDIEQDGFTIKSLKKMRFDEDLAREFYKEHAGKPFFLDLIDYMTSGDVIALELNIGGNAISQFRGLIGKTDPAEADEGTIRHKYALSKDKNSIHGSDSPEAAKREIKLLFG
ncbi:nucleoside-diphosphate kinase [Vibrio crassostreae]|uniref:nucleoside-diphosphate kinase n=1 Tax=Vibrio crassostreae TaxID=246167 RepID=UPI001B300F0A|nr:nucleoside-diphosphate kinase [Vibrio crassostreae]